MKRKTGKKEALRFSYPDLLLLAVALGALAWAIRFIIPGVLYDWDHDAGYFLARSVWIARGLKPWRDYLEIYTPLMMYLNSIPMALGLSPELAVHGLTFAWIGANALATYRLARVWELKRPISILLTAFYLLFQDENRGGHMTLEHGVVFFTLLSLIRIRTAKNLKAVYASGFLAACAFFCKQVGVISALPFLALIFQKPVGKSKQRFIKSWAAGYASPFFLVLAFYGFDLSVLEQGWIRPFLEFGVNPERPYYSVLHRVYETSPVTFSLSLTGILLVFINLSEKRVPAARKIWILGMLTGLVLYFLPRYRQDYMHYSLNCWPFIASLLVLPWGKWGHRKYLLTPTIVVALGLGSIRAHKSALEWIGYFDRPVPPGKVDEIYLPIARRIREILPPESPILVLGEEPVIEFLSGMRAQDLRTEFPRPYSKFEDIGNLTVLVDHGQPGLKERRTQLQDKGYVLDPRVVKGWFQTVEIWVRK